MASVLPTPAESSSSEPFSPKPSSRETIQALPHGDSPETPPPTADQAKSTTLSTPQLLQSVPAFSFKTKCAKCSTSDAIPVQAVLRLVEGTAGGKLELFEMFVEGIGLRDIPLCSGCFMRAKGCVSFQWRLSWLKTSFYSTKSDADAITAEECFGCFEIEYVKHIQRFKDVDELINYVRGLGEPSFGILGAAAADFDPTLDESFTGLDTSKVLFDDNVYANDHRQRTVGGCGPSSFRPPPSKDSPVQIADLLALKEVSESYIMALGKTGVAGSIGQRRQIAHCTNHLLEDLMRVPPVGFGLSLNGKPATNAKVPNSTRFYCGICQWCRSSLARLESFI